MTDLRVNPPAPPVFIEPIDEPARFMHPTARDLQSIMQEQRVAAASLNLRAALGRTVERYQSHIAEPYPGEMPPYVVISCKWCSEGTALEHDPEAGAYVGPSMTVEHAASCQTRKGASW